MTVCAFGRAPAAAGRPAARTCAARGPRTCARLLRLGVGLHVVIAVGQAQSARVGEGDHLVGIPKSWLEPKPNSMPLPWTPDACCASRGRQIGFALERGDLVQRAASAERRRASRRRLHPCTRANSRRSSAARRCAAGLGGSPRREFPTETARSRLPVCGRRSSGLVGRDGVALHPTAAGVLVKIHARIGRFVHRRKVQARRVRQLVQRALGRRAGRRHRRGRRRSPGLLGLRLHRLRRRGFRLLRRVLRRHERGAQQD